MAFDAFLDIPSVDGESTQSGFEGKIDIISFSFGASNPVTIGTGTGSGAGKVSLSSFSVMKKSDKASANLFLACCNGDHFDTAKVTMRKAGGTSPVQFLVYDFEEVFVESIQWSGSSGGDDSPMESVSFTFGKVKSTYTPQKADGTADSPIDASWDQRTGTR